MKNLKLTPEQKKMEREYARMESIIESARKGQDLLMRQEALLGEVGHDKRQLFYDTYQSQIQAAEARMAHLKEQAREMRATA